MRKIRGGGNYASKYDMCFRYKFVVSKLLVYCSRTINSVAYHSSLISSLYRVRHSFYLKFKTRHKLIYLTYNGKLMIMSICKGKLMIMSTYKGKLMIMSIILLCVAVLGEIITLL